MEKEVNMNLMLLEANIEQIIASTEKELRFAKQMLGMKSYVGANTIVKNMIDNLLNLQDSILRKAIDEALNEKPKRIR